MKTLIAFFCLYLFFIPTSEGLEASEPGGRLVRQVLRVSVDNVQGQENVRGLETYWGLKVSTRKLSERVRKAKEILEKDHLELRNGAVIHSDEVTHLYVQRMVRMAQGQAQGELAAVPSSTVQAAPGPGSGGGSRDPRSASPDKHE